MLFCDGCDLATYHMACLQPPIEEVPDDDWFCPICEQVFEIARSISHIFMLGFLGGVSEFKCHF